MPLPLGGTGPGEALPANSEAGPQRASPLSQARPRLRQPRATAGALIASPSDSQTEPPTRSRAFLVPQAAPLPLCWFDLKDRRCGKGLDTSFPVFRAISAYPWQPQSNVLNRLAGGRSPTERANSSSGPCRDATLRSARRGAGSARPDAKTTPRTRASVELETTRRSGGCPIG
jgi:hypothetical protein